MLGRVFSPTFWSWFHAAATVVWMLLLIPALLLWKDSVPFLVLISVWANIAAHWSSFQAARADKRVDEK